MMANTLAMPHGMYYGLTTWHKPHRGTKRFQGLPMYWVCSVPYSDVSIQGPNTAAQTEQTEKEKGPPPVRFRGGPSPYQERG
jgi:hypothetical protein